MHVDGDGDRLEFAAQVYHEDNTLHPHPVRALVTVVPNTGGFKLLIGRDIFEIEAAEKRVFPAVLVEYFRDGNSCDCRGLLGVENRVQTSRKSQRIEPQRYGR